MRRLLSVILSLTILISAIPVTAVDIQNTTATSEIKSESSKETHADCVDDCVDVENGNIEDYIEYEDKNSSENPDSEAENSFSNDKTISGVFDGHIVNVTGELPDNCTLSLSAVDTDLADELVSQVAEGESVFACDIKIIDADGNEWQPDGMLVDVSISKLDVNDEQKLKVLHFSEEIETVLAQDDPAESVDVIEDVTLDYNGEAGFDTYSFSTFIAFTVDFHYNGITYSIGGMTHITLSDLFAQLQIQKDATTATSVVFSDESLVSVERQEDGDWLIQSLGPFSTEETLTITFEDGEKLVIDVTDAITTSYILGYYIDENGKTHTHDSVTSEIVVSSGQLVFIFITDDVAFSKPITVQDGGSLWICIATDAHSTDYAPILKRASGYTSSPLIRVQTGGQLTMRNNWNYSNYRDSLTTWGAVQADCGGASNKENIYCKTCDKRFDLGGTQPVKDLTPEGTPRSGSGGTYDLQKIIVNGRNYNCTEPLILFNSTGSYNSFSEDCFAGITFMNSVLTTGASYYGSAVSVYGKRGDIAFNRCDFIDCKAQKSGGGGAAVYLGDYQRNRVSFFKCTFTGCYATGNGGSICINGSFADLDSTNTDYDKDSDDPNTAKPDSSFEVKQCTFDETTNNNAYASGSGGAVYVNVSSVNQIKINNNTFYNCKAGSNGGAVCLGGTVTNLYVKGNTIGASGTPCTASGSGGGMYLTPTVTTLQFQSNSITYNTATADGGGVYWGFTPTSATNSGNTITYNSASSEGGGIYCNGTAALTTTNINNNSAKTAGGGIYLYAGTFSVSNAVHTNKVTAGAGGGAYVRAGSLTISNKVYSNTASTNGGGIYNAGTTTVTSTVYSNTGSSAGGGIYNAGGTTTVNGEIYSNVSPSGGGIYNASGTVNAKSNVRNHTSTTNGGGVYSAGGTTNVTGTINANTVSGAGGGIYASAGTVNANSNVNNNTANGTLGGGVYITSSSAKVVVTGSVFSNTAKTNGGGIYNNGSTTSSVGGAVYSNTAGSNGGGLYNNSGTFPITGEVYSNTATAGSGGGVYANTGTVNLGNNVRSNYAKGGTGGGIHSASATVNVNNSKSVYSNQSSSHGHGIYTNSGTIKVTGSVYGNKSSTGSAVGNGGGIYTNTGAVTVSGSVYNNLLTVNGGGVFVNGAATVSVGTVGGSDANKNTATESGGGIYNKTGTVTAGAVSYNTAKNGGGIYNGSTGTVTVPSVSSNTASTAGGGVYATSGAVTVNGNVSANKANGGNGGGILATSGGEVNVNGGAITGNTSTANGGGIYVGNGASDTDLSKFTAGTNTTIYGNLAGTAGDDVFSTGSNTDLAVPEYSTMGIAGYVGWYEDYANNDANYPNGTALDTISKLGSRYRSALNPPHSRKYLIPSVNTSTNSAKAVNATNAYVAMTLGSHTNGFISVTKTVTADFGDGVINVNNEDDTTFTFKILKSDGSAISTSGVTVAINGNSSTNINSDGTFSIKGGDLALISGLAVGDYKVTEIANEYILSTTHQIYSTYTNSTSQTYQGADTSVLTINDGHTTRVDYTNQFKTVNVTFKFYDRSMTNGIPIDINETATTYAKVLRFGSDYITSNNLANLSAMITDAGVVFGNTYNNIVDQYYLWDSQANAVTGINAINGKIRDYSGKDLTYHTDRYGRAQGDAECEINDSEKWVTYLNNGTEVMFEDNNTLGSSVTDISIWLYNTPKTYSVKICAAKADSALVENNNGKYVATDTTYSNSKVYYNQRLGDKIDNATDAATVHLNAYGISGYLDEYINTSPIVNDDGIALKFAYWSFDINGETVASTDTYYNNRVTNDLNLYAVYEVDPSKAPGVTITYSDSDLYFDANGIAKTRLNTMINPYNCTSQDNNIDMISVIYVVSSTGESVDVGQFRDIIAENLKDKTENFTITTSDPKQVYYVYVNPELSNKNRVQFTGSFKTSSLCNKSVTVFAAMHYNGKGLDEIDYNNWIVSDNCVEYKFDSNGACTSTSF